jgi:predicted RNA-binding protein with PUA-like domain
MRIGDGVLFYHSSCDIPGIAGIAKVASKPHPDASQFDRKSEYYDPKSKPEEPRWMLVDVKLAKKTRVMPLDELRTYPELADMVVLKRGNRLSITPVTEREWNFILKKLDG